MTEFVLPLSEEVENHVFLNYGHSVLWYNDDEAGIENVGFISDWRLRYQIKEAVKENGGEPKGSELLRRLNPMDFAVGYRAFQKHQAAKPQMKFAFAYVVSALRARLRKEEEQKNIAIKNQIAKEEAERDEEFKKIADALAEKRRSDDLKRDAWWTTLTSKEKRVLWEEHKRIYGFSTDGLVRNWAWEKK